jgi:hypothetical protein
VHEILALQQSAGNASVTRMLRASRPLLARAKLLDAIGTTEPRGWFFGENTQHGWGINDGMPEGWHVTIYPDLVDLQSHLPFSKATPVWTIPGADAIQFSRFNVTAPNKTHFYFHATGSVDLSNGAGTSHPTWRTAIVAALTIFRRIGVGVTAQQLYDQLHAAGRETTVDPLDIFVSAKEQKIQEFRKAQANRAGAPQGASGGKMSNADRLKKLRELEEAKKRPQQPAATK